MARFFLPDGGRRDRMNTAEDGLPLPQRYWAILNLAVGIALSVLDSAIANIALPAIAKEIHASAADSIWVINAYQLAVVISLLPFASLGDIFGYRRIYIIGLVVFTGAALVSALSHSLLMLTLGRALQGLGAAGIMSVNTALVRFTYPRRQLGRGIAMVSVVVSISSAAGPSVAAAILAVASWPWLFAINVPIGLAALLMSWRLLPVTPASEHRFDLLSAVLSAVAFAFLISGINSIGHHHPAFLVASELAGGFLVGYVLVRRQSSLAMPLLPVDLFKRPVFTLSVATAVSAFVAQGIVFVALPFYFQDMIGRSQVETGLLMTPWPVTVAIIAPIAGRLADRYPAGILGGIGLWVLCLGFVLLALLPAQPGDASIVWRIVVCGFGFGFFQSPNNRAIVSSAPRERSGGAGAIQATARLLGQTIGAALVALVFGYAGPGGGTSPRTAILIAAGFSALAAVVSLSRLLNSVRLPRRTSVQVPARPNPNRDQVPLHSPSQMTTARRVDLRRGRV
jgi:MFS transporter, DHA2 family, multidrug resistance protein